MVLIKNLRIGGFMLPLFQAEELARMRYKSLLADMQLTREHNRSIRQGKARKDLERIIEEDIHSGAGLGELKREMVAVLRRVAG